MHATEVREVPVLIVGAGPAGLTAAITLARHGIGSLLVERRADLSSIPRATAVSTRTMEIFRSWELEKEIRSGGVEVEWSAWLTENLASGEGVAMPLGYPTREQAAVVSPTTPACVPQDHLEPVLLNHLRSLPGADVRFGTELVALDQDAGGVTAVVRERASGASTLLRARYVVAADGAHSTVRAGLGIPMEGPDDLVRHSTVLFRAPLWQIIGDRRFGLYVITHPEAAGVLVPVGADDRWLYGQESGPDRQRVEDHGQGRTTELIRAATGMPDLQPEIERVGHFSFAAQIAASYRDRRVFLVGDAAHRVTPRGGTGMNTAIHDGYDIAWKLAWVLSNWAGPGLLDSYETERRAIGLHNTARSADPNGSQRDSADGLAVDLAGRIPHVWLGRTGDQLSTLDLLGPGLTVLTGPDPATWRGASFTGASTPIDVHSVDDVTARVLGIRGEGAILVRPDGQPVGWWPAAVDHPVGAVREAIDRMTRAPASTTSTAVAAVAS